jgi:exodeoxyribonuclease VII large subunit
MALQNQLAALTRQLTRAMQKNLSRRAESLDYLMMRRIWHDPGELLNNRLMALQYLNQRLSNSMQKYIESRQHALAMGAAGLDNLSPLKVMSRGYAILTQQEKIIKRIDDVSLGIELTARISDGRIFLEVKEKEKI